MAKELTCPNCGPEFKLVVKSNGDGVCPNCSGTFTPGPEKKLVGVGEFDELKGKVTQLEGDNAKLHAENDELRKLLPQQPPKPADDPDETDPDEEDI